MYITKRKVVVLYILVQLLLSTEMLVNSVNKGKVYKTFNHFELRTKIYVFLHALHINKQYGRKINFEAKTQIKKRRGYLENSDTMKPLFNLFSKY